MDELTIAAKVENLQTVLDYIEERLGNSGVSMKLTMKILVAAEEIYVNIAHYAYGEGIGDVTIDLRISEENSQVEITFDDSGQEYNPLEKEDPDIGLSAAERQIGGLGIFMVKEMMSDVRYEYVNGHNRLTIVQNL